MAGKPWEEKIFRGERQHEGKTITVWGMCRLNSGQGTATIFFQLIQKHRHRHHRSLPYRLQVLWQGRERHGDGPERRPVRWLGVELLLIFQSSPVQAGTPPASEQNCCTKRPLPDKLISPFASTQGPVSSAGVVIGPLTTSLQGAGSAGSMPPRSACQNSVQAITVFLNSMNFLHYGQYFGSFPHKAFPRRNLPLLPAAIMAHPIATAANRNMRLRTNVR